MPDNISIEIEVDLVYVCLDKEAASINGLLEIHHLLIESHYSLHLDIEEENAIRVEILSVKYVSNFEALGGDI